MNSDMTSSWTPEAPTEANKPMSYRDAVCLEKRLSMAEKVRKRYPQHVPIIAETKDPEMQLDKQKFLCPGHMKVAEFSLILRRRICDCNEKNAKTKKDQKDDKDGGGFWKGKSKAKKVLPPEAGLYLFIHDTIPSANANLGDIYDDSKDPDDGLLYISYARENTFGY